MSIASSEMDWAGLGRRLQIENLSVLIEERLTPVLECIPVEYMTSKGERRNRLYLPFMVAMIGFGASQTVLMLGFRNGLLGFVTFFPLFFGWLTMAFYIFRRRVTSAVSDGMQRFILRSKALSILADELALKYVPSPGGAPKALRLIAKIRFAPAALLEACTMLDTQGGMDDTLAVARKSGTMISGLVIGSKAQREKHYETAAQYAHVEDGFRGVIAGVHFDAFEWRESNGDSPSIYHLVVVVRAPHRLHGITQLRTRHISWPGSHPDTRFSPVGVVAPEFENRFRIRTTDQVEARTIFDLAVIERVAHLAHGEKVRAVAFEQHIVIDVEGTDRFAIVDLVTGEWDRQSVANSITNIADMLDLVKTIVAAFRLGSSRDSQKTEAKAS